MTLTKDSRFNTSRRTREILTLLRSARPSCQSRRWTAGSSPRGGAQRASGCLRAEPPSRSPRSSSPASARPWDSVWAIGRSAISATAAGSGSAAAAGQSRRIFGERFWQRSVRSGSDQPVTEQCSKYLLNREPYSARWHS